MIQQKKKKNKVWYNEIKYYLCTIKKKQVN